MISLISKAYATSEPAIPAPSAPMANLPTPGEAFLLNMGMIVLLVGLFWVLLIMPQQKRFKKHREMLSAMKKGDKVLTAAGFIGTIDKINEDDDEVVVDLGGGMKVTALRTTIQNRETSKPEKAENKDKERKTKNKEKETKEKDKK